MVSKKIIQLKDVHKVYSLGESKVHALNGVNLSINEGDFVVILGPSGSGKSTMMNMVGALDTPTKGTIFLEGKDISKLHESNLAQIRGQKIGFVFQQFNLMPVLNAVQNVALPMIFQNKTKKEREERAAELLTMVGLGERLDHRPNQLSGGEMQRVAIARALANNPKVVLADEPTGNLDSKTGEQIMAIFEKLYQEEKKTIILVTHDTHLVKYSHKAIYLKDGIIIKEDTNNNRKNSYDHQVYSEDNNLETKKEV